MGKIKYALILIFVFFAFSGIVDAATLSVSPASGTFKVGDRVTARIMVSTSEPINAISGVVSFPSSIFVIESISKAGSILNFWVTEPNFSQGAGKLSFEGLTLGGYPGGTGTVVTAVLKAVSPGTGSVVFQSGQVLLNDGQGTDGTSGMGGAVFSVEAKAGSVPVVVPITKDSEIPEIEEAEETEEVEVFIEEQIPPKLESPEISLVKKSGEKVIEGMSEYPNAQVVLTFASESGTRIFITGVTDENGEFEIAVPKTLKYGKYKVSAIVIQEDLEHSHSSNEIEIVVGNIISDIDKRIGVALIIIGLILIYFVRRGYRFAAKNGRLRFFVKKEVKDVKEMVKKTFDVLNEDLDNNIDKKTRVISKDKIQEMKSDLKDAEDFINKEIRDVEKL